MVALIELPSISMVAATSRYFTVNFSPSSGCSESLLLPFLAAALEILISSPSGFFLFSECSYREIWVPGWMLSIRVFGNGRS